MVSTRQVQLPAPAIIVYTPKVLERIASEHQIRIEPVIAEVAQLAAVGALPAQLETGTTPRLLLYTQHHVVKLNPSDGRDAYRLNHVAPLKFRDQEKLLTGALVLHCPAGWYPASNVNQLPRDLPRIWDLLEHEWQAMLTQPETRRLPPGQSQYLNLLDDVVEAGRDIEMARQRGTAPSAYRRRGSTRETRYSARGVYEFDLLQAALFGTGTLVQIDEDPQLRGRVTFVEDHRVTVRFDTTVDYARIPAQGALHVLPSQAVSRAQALAIETLREGRGTNPDLLINLVDRRMRPYQLNRTAIPNESLDPTQLEAFHAALSVPDQLLVLGPPGTGKTRVITAIATASVEAGDRVLLSAYTNRALDNALERLPDTLRIVRVGNEDSMTAQARGFTVEAQVQTLRLNILAGTEGTVSRLAGFSGEQAHVVGWNSFLNAVVDQATVADQRATLETGALAVAKARIAAPLADSLETTHGAVQRAEARVTQLEHELRHAGSRLTAAQQQSSNGLLSLAFRWLVGRRTRLVTSLTEQLLDSKATLAQAESAASAVHAEIERLVTGDEEVTARRAAHDWAVQARDTALSDAVPAAQHVHAAIQFVTPGFTRQPPTHAKSLTLAEWDRYRREASEAVMLNCRRANLIGQWRDAIGAANEELQRELVRLADVVAATCIGTVTTPLLSGQEFDVALIDEAAQISTPNLLVPLIRARRSVLVGDHHQLPPYLDNEVKSWAEKLTRSGSITPDQAREIRDLLYRSAFERLFIGAPEGHRVMLTVQRRMPEPLARFVSQHFYGGALHSAHPGAAPDPFFRAPLALVDTSDKPAAQRAEQRGRGGEEWGEGSVRNELEATLISEMIADRIDLYRDWAVIVPYKAQVTRLVQLLTQALGDAEAVTANVGTVDAFQGGERDLIIYGFTRSNPHGQIGFLKELRRINVAITRARRQLILVGDLSTLRNADDSGFTKLIGDLTEYLTIDGEIVLSQDIRSRRSAETRPERDR